MAPIISSMPIRAGVCLAAKDFFSQATTLNDAALMLARMKRSSVLRSCAQLSALNETVIRFNGGWHSAGSRSFVPEFARLIFPTSPRLQKRVQEICAAPNFTAAFLDFAIAGLMGIACRYCPSDKGQDLTKDLRRRENLTRILLQLQQDAFPSDELLLALNTGRFESVFAKSTRSIMATVSTQNEWFKDLGRLHLLTSVPQIGKALAAKSTYKDALDWFQSRLGTSVQDYEALSHIFLACAFTGSLNDAPMFRDFMAVNVQKFDFLRLTITTPEKVVQAPEPETLEAALFGPLPLWVSPILDDGTEFHISSRAWLFNKFLRGLPYLVLETERARNGGELADNDAKSIRGEFGLLFEAYIRWLFSQWFHGSPVEVVAPYFIKTIDGNWREKDIALLFGQVAYPFEIKALVPPLRLRQSGELTDWLSYFTHIASQVTEAAEAMIDGRAFYADCSTRLPDVKKAFPCAVTYETTPFRQPVVIPFESALSTKLGRNLFVDGDSIGPLQLFDVEAIESWDEFFDLPSDSERLLTFLEQRARSVMHRYSSFSRFQINRSAEAQKKEGVLTKATAEAAEAVLARANDMSAQVPLPDFLQPFGPQLRTVGGPWPRRE